MSEKNRLSPAGTRTYTRIFNFIFFLALVFVFLFELACSSAPSGETELKVMTFNVRFDNPADGQHNWKFRREAATRLIQTLRVDLLGTQEVLNNQLEDFLEKLPGYGYIGVGREDGRTAGEYSAVFYLKERFLPVKSGNFWLSQTPEIPGSRGWDAACERIVTWAIFRENKSGLELAFFNTHFDHVGQEARRQSARLLLEKIKALAGNLPVILSGDFNAPPDSEPVRIILDNGLLVDSRSSAAAVMGPAWSFHGFGRLPEEERQLIDFIFISPHFRVLEYQNIFEEIGDTYYSDHNPVLVRLRLKADRT
ncbi:MAG: endonuclease/exonuclease/phosphatase family protein [Candidatus Saccharicenans sp.]|jgi:endonuclease/exonuclease/phosphatase family metal-dependent hydrolase|nr:endonuclease/exonuclease/phosphatase family protein [Candidatus Saccharicenans sp.]MDH7574207.1 endonuclease/exonuclease/phosphatase family protein [Candidatus Saccharicenans sp.]